MRLPAVTVSSLVDEACRLSGANHQALLSQGHHQGDQLGLAPLAASVLLCCCPSCGATACCWLVYGALVLLLPCLKCYTYSPAMIPAPATLS